MNRRLFLGFLLSAPAAAEWRRDNREACERIDQKLDEIERKRRAGYGAREGARLSAQREKLRQSRREKCR